MGTVYRIECTKCKTRVGYVTMPAGKPKPTQKQLGNPLCAACAPSKVAPPSPTPQPQP